MRSGHNISCCYLVTTSAVAIWSQHQLLLSGHNTSCCRWCPRVCIAAAASCLLRREHQHHRHGHDYSTAALAWAPLQHSSTCMGTNAAQQHDMLPQVLRQRQLCGRQARLPRTLAVWLSEMLRSCSTMDRSAVLKLRSCRSPSGTCKGKEQSALAAGLRCPVKGCARREGRVRQATPTCPNRGLPQARDHHMYTQPAAATQQHPLAPRQLHLMRQQHPTAPHLERLIAHPTTAVAYAACWPAGRTCSPNS